MKLKFEFSIGTRYVGSDVKDEIELEFDDDATEQEIESQVEEVYKDWVWEQVDGGWKRK